MSINLTEASSLATIDSQIKDDRHDLSPAQYEIIRQVIYHTADFEYYSLLKFSEDALLKGLKALKDGLPIVVDVPEIQVSIVPRLQQTFHNPVFCSATIGTQINSSKTKAAFGLEILASDRPNSIFIIGQDRVALTTLVELIKNEVVNPSLIVSTAPSIIDQDINQYFKHTAIPTIYVDSPKGGATVASAIFNALVNLAWRASNQFSDLDA